MEKTTRIAINKNRKIIGIYEIFNKMAEMIIEAITLKNMWERPKK